MFNIPKNIPNDIEKVIHNYVNQLNHYTKYKHVIEDIKENIEVQYLIPFWDANTGYLAKSIKYKKKNFKNLSQIICSCCGREMMKSLDEYTFEDASDEIDVEIQLCSIRKSIMKDVFKGRCKVMKDFNEKIYTEICNEIFERQDQEEGFFIGRMLGTDNNEFEILLNVDSDGEIEIIDESDIEDEEEIILELTLSETEELMRDFNENDFEDIDE